MMHLALLAVAAAAAAATASQPARTDKNVLITEDPVGRKYELEWGYADAVIAGDTVYLSGVVAGLRDGETDPKLAYERAFERIGKILTRAGTSWDNVVDLTSFHTDLTTQIPAIVAVKNKYVHAPPPAWTAIEVSRLIPDRGITEIKIVAKLPAGNR